MNMNPRASQLPKKLLASYRASRPARKKIIIAIVLITLLFGVFGIRRLYVREQAKPPVVGITKKVIEPLALLSHKEYIIDAGSDAIELEFSRPIDIHELTHATTATPFNPFTTQPVSDGVLNASITTGTRFMLVPSNTLLSGTYTIEIDMGLLDTGSNRQENVERITVTVQKKAEAQEVYFEALSDQLWQEYKSRGSAAIDQRPRHRILTVNANEAFRLLALKARQATTYTFYRSDQKRLLRYLAYTPSQESSGYRDIYSYRWSDKYKETSIAHQPHEQLNMDIDGIFNLTPGVYYVESKDNETITGSTFIIANSLGIVARYDDQKLILHATDFATGRDLTNPLTYELYNLEESVKKVDTFAHKTPITTHPIDISKRLDVVVATNGKESALVPFLIPMSYADIRSDANLSKQVRIVLTTDKPIYKPGDTVHFRGTARYDEDALYAVVPDGTRIYLNSDELEYKHEVQTTDGGVFFGAFQIDKNTHLPKDEYQNGIMTWLNASANANNAYDGASSIIEIQNYSKPTFGLTASTSTQTARVDETISFDVSGTYLDGLPLKNEVVTYTVYTQEEYETPQRFYNASFNVGAGGMCGGGGFNRWLGQELSEAKSITLDESGHARVDLNIKNLLQADQNTSSDIVGKKILVNVAFSRQNGQDTITSVAKTVVLPSRYALFVNPGTTSVAPGTTYHLPLALEQRDNAQPAANKKVSYMILNTDSTPKQLASGTVVTDQKGVAQIDYTIPTQVVDNDSINIVMTVVDEDQNTLKQSVRLFVSKPTASGYTDIWTVRTPYITVYTDKSLLRSEESATLTFSSPKDITTLMTLERGRIYEPQTIHIPAGVSQLTIPMRHEFSPSIALTLSYFADGVYYNDGINLNIPALHKLLNVAITTDKEQYAPNDTAKVRIVVKDSRGRPVHGARLGLTVVDKAIYLMRPDSIVPAHSQWYAARRPSVNSSSSKTPIQELFGGRGGGSEGDGLGNAIDTLYVAPDLTTNELGETTAEVDLKGYTTTWKAVVYASDRDSNIGQAALDFTASQK